MNLCCFKFRAAQAYLPPSSLADIDRMETAVAEIAALVGNIAKSKTPKPLDSPLPDPRQSEPPQLQAQPSKVYHLSNRPGYSAKALLPKRLPRAQKSPLASTVAIGYRKRSLFIEKTGWRNSLHVILPNKTCSLNADSGAVLGHELARWSVDSDRRYRRAGGAFDL